MRKNSNVPTHFGIILLFLLSGILIVVPEEIAGQNFAGFMALLWAIGLISQKRFFEKTKKLFSESEFYKKIKQG